MSTSFAVTDVRTVPTSVSGIKKEEYAIKSKKNRRGKKFNNLD